MASALSISKFFANAMVQMWDHDPGATTAVICSPDGGTTKRIVDLRDYEGFAVIVMTSVLGGSGVTKVEIVASEDSAGATNLTVVKDSGTVAADAVGDFVALECTAEELAQLDPDLRYVAARITCQHAGDEAVVTYIRHKPRFATSGLTATTIA